MESVISRLLSEFENGKMTRRQLVQSLALAAVGVPVASAVAQTMPTVPAIASGSSWKTVWLDHISYAVSDYKRSTDFYADLMGWKVLKDDGTRQATLDINGIGGIIIRNGGPAAAASTSAVASAGSTAAGRAVGRDGSAGRAAGAPITGVINHVSWGVEPWDTEAVKADLERRGLTPRPDMVGADFKSFHVKDPDGWDLQISNQTKTRHDLNPT